ncbi:MAG: radical SAM protein [Candidatus Parabeggiatoa sp.]|nr:radical SAM protein [Candidatus Parabeggiatoa sp.]
MIQLNNDTIIHLDAPTVTTSKLKNTPIQGWIVCNSTVNKVWISARSQHELKWVERPDVINAFPSYSEVKGFVGIVPTNELNGNSITLFCQVGENVLSHTFPLEESEEQANISSTLDFLKAINNQLYADDVAQKRSCLESTPIHINLEMTNRCNLSCPTCARNYWDEAKNPIGEMDTKMIELLSPYLERASYVGLLGYGEAVLSTQFKPIVSLITQFKPTFGMFNNGTTLGSRQVDFILDTGINGLVISIDGADEKTVQHTRTASLKKILRNVNYLRNRSVERNMKAPQLSLSFTASQRNINQLIQLIDLAKENGFVEIHIGMAKIFHPSLVAESLFLAQEHATQKFVEAQEYGEKQGIKVNIPPLFGATVSCQQPFELFMVKWNGNVRLCCSTAIESEPPLYINTGNLYKESLEQLWNGEMAQSVRSGLLGLGEMNEICAKCPYTKCTLERYTRLLQVSN